MTKQQVPMQVGSYIDMDGDLDGIIARLTSLREEHGPTASITWEPAPYSDSDREYAYLYVQREETDAEYANRQANEAFARSAQEKRERETLAMLQGKYGIVPQPS